MLEDFVILNIFVNGMISDYLYYNGSYMNLLIVKFIYFYKGDN
jgi:hypothetical protein